MNKPEAAVYASMARTLYPCPITFKRVENSMDTGTPDVYFYSLNNEGWIELKQIPKLPASSRTSIVIPFRPGQYAWLMSRYKENKKTSGFLFIKIEDVYFLFKNECIQEEYTRQELLELSRFMSKGTINQIELFNALDK